MKNILIGRSKEKEVLLKTRKQVFLNLLTTFGLKHNEHSLGLIDKALTMNALFTEEE